MSQHFPSTRFRDQGYAKPHTQPNPTNRIQPSRHKKYRAKNVVVIAGGNALSSHTLRNLVESSSANSRRCHERLETFQVSSQLLQAVLESCRRDPLGYAAKPTSQDFLNSVMLSKRLRSVRLQNNVSLIELAKKSRVPIQVLADYEQGWQQPDQTTLQRLALALHVQVTELLSVATK